MFDSFVHGKKLCSMSTWQTPKSAHLVAFTRFRWSWWSKVHIVCGFSHLSSESRRCNGFSAYFRVWHENVMDYFLQCISPVLSSLIFILWLDSVKFSAFLFDFVLMKCEQTRHCVCLLVGDGDGHGVPAEHIHTGE